MTTLQPRGPYTPEELAKLYPANLQLQHVQILLRHAYSGVSALPECKSIPLARLNQAAYISADHDTQAGLKPYWPYCNAARQLRSVIMATKDWSKWDELSFRRRLETFGEDDGPVIASGPEGEYDGICQLGELTDKGRETTLALGQRLRHLYVDQLRFMPRLISDADMIYLRATPLPRALESIQQSFWGLYPPSARTAAFPPPTIITRTPSDETLYPNDSNCRRFAQLSRAFAQRTADRWNDSKEIDYLNRLLSKWMPPTSPRVAVDSHPRLSGIMDTVNSTLAHGPQTRLPKEFYDEKAREIIDKIGVEEWFAGYKESEEYRALGVGALVGDIVSRMTGHIERSGADGLEEIGGEDGHLGQGRGGEKEMKFGMSGCHDTTLAGIITSLGAFEGERWPPYSSHIAFELFRARSLADNERTESINDSAEIGKLTTHQSSRHDDNGSGSKRSESWLNIFKGASKGNVSKSNVNKDVTRPGTIFRRRIQELSDSERAMLKDYYVRLRYNDRVMSVPGCRPVGKHLDGDESFCTFDAFKAIVDKFVPQDWKRACTSNIDEPAFPAKLEPAGYP